jgi:hypothetical protein
MAQKDMLSARERRLTLRKGLTQCKLRHGQNRGRYLLFDPESDDYPTVAHSFARGPGC